MTATTCPKCYQTFKSLVAFDRHICPGECPSNLNEYLAEVDPHPEDEE